MRSNLRHPAASSQTIPRCAWPARAGARLGIALLATLLLGAGAPAPRRWLGHVMTVADSRLPILGDISARSDSQVILEEHSEPGADLVLHQLTCRVALQDVAGVHMHLDAATPPRLPPVRFRLQPDGPRHWRGHWDSGWDARDHDLDGQLGVSLHVRVPLCSGTLYLATQSHTEADVHQVGAVLLGETRIRTKQTILGASNACLRLVARDRNQVLGGAFRLEPWAGGFDCSAVPPSAWPHLD